MNTPTVNRIIIPDQYDTSVNNTKLNNNFPVSSLGLDPSPIPGVSSVSVVTDDVTIEDLDVVDLYGSVYGITSTKEDREVFNLIQATAEESLPEGEIEGLEFSLIKRNTLKNYAIKIFSDEKSGPGTINDPRLGVTKGSDRCATCHKSVEECPGH